MPTDVFSKAILLQPKIVMSQLQGEKMDELFDVSGLKWQIQRWLCIKLEAADTVRLSRFEIIEFASNYDTIREQQCVNRTLWPSVNHLPLIYFFSLRQSSGL